MSCCLCFSKIWIWLFSILFLLVGIGMVIVSLFYLNFDEIIPSKDYKNNKKYILFGGIGFAVLLLLLSILGILVVKLKKKNCISLVYAIIIIILFLLFAGLGLLIYF